MTRNELIEKPDRAILAACSLGERELAARSEALRTELFAAAEEMRELAEGYAFRFPPADEWKKRVLAFIETERRCCSFFRMELGFEPNLGPIWLRLTGPDGVKAFVRETFAAHQEDGQRSESDVLI